VHRDEFAKAMPPPQQPGPGVLGLLSDRTVITSVALFGFVIIRVLVVARGDVPMALAITSGVGVATVVVNTIVGSIQFLAFTTILVLSVLLSTGRIIEAWRLALAVAAIVILDLVVFFTADWFTFLASLSIPIFALIRRRRFSHRGSMLRDEAAPLAHDRRRLSALPGPPASTRNRIRSAVRHGLSVFLPIAVVVMFSVILILAVVSPVWLPAEILKIDNQSQVTGYVLNDQGDWYSILKDKPRSIVRVHKTRIKERTVCLTTPQAQSAENTALRLIGRQLGRPTQLPEPLCS
jgi:hypothetical protein